MLLLMSGKTGFQCCDLCIQNWSIKKCSLSEEVGIAFHV